MSEFAIINTGAFLLILGVILYIGVVASFIFEKYKIPDILNLILIGLFLGPIFHLIDPNLMKPWMPVVGSIALGLILFEAGLDLDLDRILKRFGQSFALAAGTFFATGIVIAWVYRALAGAPWVHCLLLGTTLGCVSSAVILPISNLLSIPEGTKTTIHLEAALSDMMGVVLTLVLIRVVGVPDFEPGHAFGALTTAFAVAVLFAGLFGMVWLWVLSRLKESPFSYMMTLAAVFVLYGFSDLVGGSGPMATLTFGVVMTNAHKLAKLVGRKFKFVLDEKIRQFNTEATFFVRTFFFVYLGLVVSFRTFNFNFILVVLTIFAAILVCRFLVVKGAIGFLYKQESQHMDTYISMLPRGLTSAVLVGVVQSRVAGTEQFMGYAFGIILLTNVLMTWWVYKNEKKISKAESVKFSPAPAESKKPAEVST